MPLIRGIGAWFDRRLRDTEIYGSVAADGGMSQGSMMYFWLFVGVVALPVIGFLVLIGLIYELVIRIDGHRLAKAIEWAISCAGAAAVVFAFYWVYVRH